MIAGSIVGVGSAKSYKAVSWKVPQMFLVAWILTLPGAALIGAIAYSVAKALLMSR